MPYTEDRLFAILLVHFKNRVVSWEFQLIFNYFCLFKGRGTVATGRVEQGTIKVGEEVEVLGLRQVSV